MVVWLFEMFAIDSECHWAGGFDTMWEHEVACFYEREEKVKKKEAREDKKDRCSIAWFFPLDIL